MNLASQLYIPQQLEKRLEAYRKQHESGRNVFFLGANTMQLPGLYLAARMGLRLHVADGNAKVPGRELADRFYHIDLKDRHALAEAACRLQHEEGLHGVVTMGTDFSSSVAWVAEQCGLPGIPYEAALNANRKHRMRKIFTEHGLPSPRFQSHDAAMGAFGGLEGLSFPVVVKPVDNMGARGVSMAASATELDRAVELALGFSPSGQIIIEEKIQGPEYSLDSLMFKGRQYPMGIARRWIDYPPYFIERGHSFPSDLNQEDEARMFETLHRAALALGIHDGAAKGDIFFTPEGPVIGEIAARLSGGYMSGWTFPMHSGIHPSLGALQICLGEAPDLALQGNDGSERFHEVQETGIISIPGTVRAVLLPDSAAQKPVLPHGTEVRHFISVSPGDQVRFPRNNVEKCGTIIVQGPRDLSRSFTTRALVLLEADSLKDLEFQLAGPYPHAYSDALNQLCLHTGLSPDKVPRLQDLLGSASSEDRIGIRVQLPAGTGSVQTDWNYRSIEQSLNLASVFEPRFIWEWAQPAENRASESQPGGVQAVLLYCLFRGGLQALMSALRLCFYGESADTHVQTPGGEG